jgi:hypothetical protein
MSKNTIQQKEKWFYSQSRAPFAFIISKAAKGFEAWFYTGGSVHFGHPNAHKKKAKK